jgi:hypothetical protein
MSQGTRGSRVPQASHCATCPWGEVTEREQDRGSNGYKYKSAPGAVTEEASDRAGRNVSPTPAHAASRFRRYRALMDAREERLANNEVLFREINERIADVAAPQSTFRDDHTYEFLCECSNLGCDLRMRLTLSMYEEIRKDPTQFVVALGHELPEIEIVVTRTDAYQVVRKQGDAAELAEEKDPRT